MYSLKNKIALVTGAIGLLGKEHCTALKNAGATVVVCDLDKEKCDSFAIELGNNSIGLSLDVTEKSSIEKARDEVLQRFGKIDILVNNAAINEKVEDGVNILEATRFENLSVDIFRRSLDVNITGVFLCSQIFGAVMAEVKSGTIINIASTYGIVAPDQSLYRDNQNNQTFFKSPAYPTTKSAVIGFTKYLASYWGHTGVRVNTLSPGGVENNQAEYFILKYSEKTPLGRMAKSNDFAGAIVFLASDASKYMTGANLVVDGGFTIW